MMEAIVLAGGFGTRLRQLVADVPKPMAPVAGRPFLEFVLQALAQKGFHRVVLSLGYMAETVISHFGSAYQGLDLVHEVESTPLGTGGAVRSAMSHCHSDHVYVFNGDTFIDLEVNEVEVAWSTSQTPIIVGKEVEDTARYGRLDVVAGRVRGFVEKGVGGSGLINAGCYILPSDALDGWGMGQQFSLEADFLEKKVASMRVDAFVSRGYFIDIGVPDDYMRAQKELLQFA